MAVYCVSLSVNISRHDGRTVRSRHTDDVRRSLFGPAIWNKLLPNTMAFAKEHDNCANTGDYGNEADKDIRSLQLVMINSEHRGKYVKFYAVLIWYSIAVSHAALQVAIESRLLHDVSHYIMNDEWQCKFSDSKFAITYV